MGNPMPRGLVSAAARSYVETRVDVVGLITTNRPPVPCRLARKAMLPVGVMSRPSVAPISPTTVGVVVMVVVERSRRASTPVPLELTPRAHATEPVASVTHGESMVMPEGAAVAYATTGCSTLATAAGVGPRLNPARDVAMMAVISVATMIRRRFVNSDMWDTSPLTATVRSELSTGRVIWRMEV